MNDWRIYRGEGDPHDDANKFPEPPLWRNVTSELLNTEEKEIFHSKNDPYGERLLALGKAFKADPTEVELINAALYLRRPLLISGPPGCGKSSLAYSVARELELGRVLRWSITSRTKLSDGLYHYDAIGHLQDTSRLQGTSSEKSLEIGEYIHLGPLGAALLPSAKPRVLLIDEIDKGDIDLPNDLLHIFEEGEFEIPELIRFSKEDGKVKVYYGAASHENAKVWIKKGHVRCHKFPFIFLTSNGEREFPQAFLRRCIRLKMEAPSQQKLRLIVKAHLDAAKLTVAEKLIDDLIAKFLERRKGNHLATDQLLNAVYLVSQNVDLHERKKLLEAILQPLSDI